MAHEWDRGVLNASSWHGLEEIGTFDSADSAIEHGERTGAWPTLIEPMALTTASGLVAPCEANVAHYREHDARIVGVTGDRYRATLPEEWRDLVRAAVAAGAKPTGAFSLRDGSRILATFDVGATASGIATQFVLADSFDGSLKLLAGSTSVRVVCANTLAMALGQDGKSFAKLRHTAQLEQRVAILRDGIASVIRDGEQAAKLFDRASAIVLPADAARVAFDALFPEAAPDADKRGKTRAENERTDARFAAVNPVNRVGTVGNLATLWNAATYLVDREADGSARECRGGADRLDSLLFGSRAKRVSEIQSVISRIAEAAGAETTISAATIREALDMPSPVERVFDLAMN